MGSTEKWAGGYVRKGKKWPTYVIERWVGGRHFHVSTRCRTLRAAMKQLERFEADPGGYRPEGPEGREALVLTDILVEEFAAWMLNTKGNSVEWVNDVSRYLADWIEDLGGKDLRRAPGDASSRNVSMHRDLKPALDERKTSRKHRIEAIKSFYSWLRKEKGLLGFAEDPSLDLPVPQDTPEKRRRRKVVDEERLQKVLAKLDDETRDILVLQGATAWHVSEVRRFAKAGEIRTQPDYTVVLVTTHKSKDPTRTPVLHSEHIEAAKRIRARGRIHSNSTLAERMRVACDAAGLEPSEHFRLGQMRHTVLTWAVDHGATPQQASEFAGHKSERTTRNFYLDQAVPTIRVPVLRLVPKAS